MLRIAALSKTYDNGVHALDDVTLEIGEGLFGLLGPNGAGKSTLMRTIAALQEPDSGSIHLDEVDVLADPQQLRRRLGFLPQEFGAYPGVSAQSLLDHIAVLKEIVDARDRSAQIAAALRITNLYDVRHRPVSTFSGGMKQRFGIAQALLGRPRLIIVDEPTAGLDPEERNRFHDLLSEIGETSIVLLSTHIVEDVEDLCVNMAILAGGKVRAAGSPASLLARLEGRLWQKTMTRVDLPAVASSLPVISSRLHGGKLQVHVVADSRPGEGFHPVAPTLEDVYFSVLNPAGSSETAA